MCINLFFSTQHWPMQSHWIYRDKIQSILWHSSEVFNSLSIKIIFIPECIWNQKKGVFCQLVHWQQCWPSLKDGENKHSKIEIIFRIEPVTCEKPLVAAGVYSGSGGTNQVSLVFLHLPSVLLQYGLVCWLNLVYDLIAYCILQVKWCKSVE